jgi:DNA-binding response OmpR family regulator
MPHRVLVVEDDVELRSIIVRMLGSHGFSARGSEGGRAAANSVNTEDFGLLLTDAMHTKEITGITLARIARMRWDRIPVIFMSASSSELDHAADFRPPHACIAKPFRVWRVLEAIRRMQLAEG